MCSGPAWIRCVPSPVAGLAPLTVDQSLDWYNVCGRHTSCSSLRYARPQPLDKSPRKARLCERILSGSRRRGEGKGAGSRGPLRVSPLSRRAVGLSASSIRHARWLSRVFISRLGRRRRSALTSVSLRRRLGDSAHLIGVFSSCLSSGNERKLAWKAVTWKRRSCRGKRKLR